MIVMILAEHKYDYKQMDKGYANQTLYLNLSENTIKVNPVTQEMKDKFIGGKGFDLWMMWNSLPKNKKVKWNDPENEICIAHGPLSGTSKIPGAGKCIVTTISPLTDIIVDSNVGGYFGPYLKFSGFDALEIQGKAKEDIVIYIDGENKVVRIEQLDDLPQYAHELTQFLTEKYARDDFDKSRVSVITAGPAAKNTNWGMLNFSWYNKLRKYSSYKQAGRGGIGTVFADKKIAAIVCHSTNKKRNIHPYDSKLLKKIGKAHNIEIVHSDKLQNEMRTVGSAHLPEIMNEYDLLPVENFKFGKHKSIETEKLPLHRDVWRKFLANDGTGTDYCWVGCSLACSHYVKKYRVKTGPFKGQLVIVDGPEYETIAGCGSNWGVWDPEWVLEANFYCDTYGIDTISVGTGIAFVMECYEAGIINKEITGGLDLSFGNAKNALELVHQMARGEGFGTTVGLGIRKMKKVFADKFGGDPQFLQDIGMEHKGLEFSEYVTKESLTQQGGYGFTLKGPQHDEAWLIFEDVANHSIPSFEDKAAALCWFPFWRTWFGLNGLCKLPWNDVKPLENKTLPVHHPETGELYKAKVPKHVDFYSHYFTAVTGRKSEPADLIRDSERVYNFQRIFCIRLGKGLRENDSNFPYRGIGPVTIEEYESRADRYDTELAEKIGIDPTGKDTQDKLKLVRQYREDRYSKLQDAVYLKRGWNKNGCPKIEKVKDLDIDYDDVLEVIKKHQI
ncbi:MAG: aldehyde:ferredoxin oxidoreductase [Candidatus Lokiarchaeota archaeon]|nr:aldehyde:ferredoxin oxidoreductase [Candidatus Lokiarchaeota archaeon]